MYLEIVGLVIAPFFSLFYAVAWPSCSEGKKQEFPTLLVGGATPHLALFFFFIFEGIFAA